MVSYFTSPENITHTWQPDTSTGSYNLSTGNGGSAMDYGALATGQVVGPVLVGVVLSAIVLCTVVGNVMVLLAVFVNSHLRSTTNYFIVNLAIADLLLGTTVLPFSASLEVFKVWLFGQVFCDVWAAIDVLCCTASIFSLCVISIDRYIGVTRPLQRSTIMTKRRAVYIIVFIWLLSMAISIAPLIGWKQPPSPDPYECTVTTQTGYVIFSVSASFYIPLSIILLVYFRIYREAIKHSRFLMTGVKTTKVDESGVTLRVHKGGGGMSPHVYHGQGHGQGQNSSPHYNSHPNSRASPGHQSSSSSDRSESSVGHKTTSRMTAAGKMARFKRETKAAKTLGIVVGVFILCWFPFFFILPLSSLCRHCYVPDLLFTIFFWLGYCNSLMNPVIYACSSREFQFAFRRILRCQFRRRPRVFLTDQHSERSSSCHDFNQLEPNSQPNARNANGGKHASKKKSKHRKLKFVRTFRSKRADTQLNNHRPISLQSFHDPAGALNAETPGAGSSTESLRALHKNRRRGSGGLKYGGCSEWSGSGGVGAGSSNTLRRDSISREDLREDLFEDLTVRTVYPNCGSR